MLMMSYRRYLWQDAELDALGVRAGRVTNRFTHIVHRLDAGGPFTTKISQSQKPLGIKIGKSFVGDDQCFAWGRGIQPVGQVPEVATIPSSSASTARGWGENVVDVGGWFACETGTKWGVPGTFWIGNKSCTQELVSRCIESSLENGRTGFWTTKMNDRFGELLHGMPPKRVGVSRVFSEPSCKKSIRWPLRMADRHGAAFCSTVFRESVVGEVGR